MIIPAAYASRRNLASAYERGYQAGKIASLGGVPLSPYKKRRMAAIYDVGFMAAQASKVTPPSGEALPIDAWQVEAMGEVLARWRDRKLVTFLEDKLRGQRAHRLYWFDLPNNHDPSRPTSRECVLAHIDAHIATIEEALRLEGVVIYEPSPAIELSKGRMPR